MPYATQALVQFCASRHFVFEAMSLLGRYPEWNQDMVFVSETGRMIQGMHYETETRVSGRVNRADIEVVALVPDEEIHLKSDSGLIAFNAIYHMSDAQGGGTDVICSLDFTFRNFVMHLARPAIESIARDRARNDMKTLDAILCAEQNEPEV